LASLLHQNSLDRYERLLRDQPKAHRHGPLIKEWQAPRPRTRTGEHCGRWFVGRPDQTYCSLPCQNRAGTRRVRARHNAPGPRARPRGT
jgi:hypothetical protein